MKRSPVIVVVGHVDHGKTSLLDYIRKTTVAAKEAGGITQSVGAYEVSHRNERITFIDTPGHEAFAKMRARGAHIADLAILVVAANDGVQNQTREAIKILRQTETPFIVAVTKIDQGNADVARVKNELAKEGVLLEGYGGDISWHGVSSKTGEGINDLLDLILLAAEVEGLDFDPNLPASGYILESKSDSRKGLTATMVIKDGILKKGDYIQAGEAMGRIKNLLDFRGQPVDQLSAASPAIIFGFDSLPKIGEGFITADAPLIQIAASPKAVTSIQNKNAAQKTGPTPRQTTNINLVVKADTAGSLEALSDILASLPTPPEMRLTIVEKSVGEVSDGDIKSAIAHRAAIIAFRVSVTKAAEFFARSQLVTIVQSEIIYDLTRAVEEMIKAGTIAKILGRLEVLQIFGKKASKYQIVGGKVVEGEILKSASFEIERRGSLAGKGKITNLQTQKKDATKVVAPMECGMLIDADVEIKVGDQLIVR